MMPVGDRQGQQENVSGFMPLQLARLEGIAASGQTRVETAAEPAHPLRRGAVGKGVRPHLATGLALQVVIADGIGGVQRLLQITRLQPLQTPLGVVRPNSGQAVGLQLLAHQQAVVAFEALATLAGGTDPGRDAEQRLHVMADLMGDHIGLGKVAGGGEAGFQFAEEAKVEIDLPIPRAVKGPTAASAKPQAERTPPENSTSLGS